MTEDDLLSIARHAQATVVGVSAEAFADLFPPTQRDPGLVLLRDAAFRELLASDVAAAYDRATLPIRVYRDSRVLREQVIILEKTDVRALA